MEPRPSARPTLIPLRNHMVADSVSAWANGMQLVGMLLARADYSRPIPPSNQVSQARPPPVDQRLDTLNACRSVTFPLSVSSSPAPALPNSAHGPFHPARQSELHPPANDVAHIPMIHRRQGMPLTRQLRALTEERSSLASPGSDHNPRTTLAKPRHSTPLELHR